MSDEELLRAAYATFQVGRDSTTDDVQSDTHVLHRYRLRDGLIVRMDVLDAA